MKRSKKILRILKKVAVTLWWTATVLLAVAIISIMAAKIKGEVPYFFGYSVMNIVSGSMGDTIPEGSYILIKKTDPSEIKKDDIICFYSDDPAIKGYPNTHIVIEDPIHGENGIEFVTKGEANPDKDPETAKGNKLIGKYITNLDWLTGLSRFLEGGGIIIICIVLTVLCSFCMVASILVKSSRKDPEQGSDEMTKSVAGNQDASDEAKES